MITIDHLIYGAPLLTEAVDDLEQRFGVRASEGGRHLGLGTHNALLALGRGRYLEIIAPDPARTPPPTGRPFGLDSLTRSHLVGWAARTDAIDAAITRARDRGYDPGEAIDLERTSAGETLRWRLTLNAISGGPIPFLIDWGDTPHPSATAAAGLELVSFLIEDPEPGGLTPSLAALQCDVGVQRTTVPALVAVLEGPGGRTELR